MYFVSSSLAGCDLVHAAVTAKPKTRITAWLLRITEAAPSRSRTEVMYVLYLVCNDSGCRSLLLLRWFHSAFTPCPSCRPVGHVLSSLEVNVIDHGNVHVLFGALT